VPTRSGPGRSSNETEQPIRVTVRSRRSRLISHALMLGLLGALTGVTLSNQPGQRTGPAPPVDMQAVVYCVVMDDGQSYTVNMDKFGRVKLGPCPAGP
jgi:hypothetical protein